MQFTNEDFVGDVESLGVVHAQPNPRSAAILDTLDWVMPSSAPVDVGGVMMMPLRTQKDSHQ